MGQRDSPFVPLAGGSIPPPGPCRPIRRAERELGPQKGARSATPNSNRPRSLEGGGAPFGRCPIGAVREGSSCELRWRVSGPSEPRNGFSRRFGTIPDFPNLGAGRFGPERAVLARNRDFPSLDPCSGTRKARKRAVLLASDVARPGKPGIVPSCAAECRQTRLVLPGGANPLKTNSLPPAAPSAWRLPFPQTPCKQESL